MAKMLLLNPRKRTRKARKAPSAAQKANWARFAAAAKSRSRKSRRRNPAPAVASRAAAPRRKNPLRMYRTARPARRRNPIGGRSMGGGLFNFSSYVAPLKDAAIMGAGAVAVDMAFGYVNRYLPASMQRVPGTVGVGDAVKAVLTVAMGKVLDKPTRGLSKKAALGSLVVQMRDITTTFLPPGTVGGVGWVSPARIVPGMNTRANSYSRPPARIGAYVPGPTPALSGPGVGGFVPGGTPLLSRAPVARRGR